MHRFQYGLGVVIAIVGLLLLSSVITGVGGSGPVSAGASPSNPLAMAERSLAEGQGPSGGVPTTCSPSSSTSATCSSASAGPVLGNTSGGEWVGLNYSRAYTSLAYDARDGYVLAFGGQSTNGQPLGDTWKYGFGSWSLILTATEPSPRWGAAMDYDAASGTVILFGGTNGVTYFNDTWSYSGGVWTNLGLTHAPSPRAFASMSYDANVVDNYTVLFGGLAGSTYFGGTWEFHHGAWTNLTALVLGTPPPAMGGSGMDYDNHIGQVVLFGGIGAGGYDSVTYQYKNLTWSVLTTTGPSAVAYPGLAYDRAATELVLFGGYNGASYSGQTWVMTNETWSGPLATSGPSARDGASMVFDGLHKDFYVVQWGGYSGGGVYASDTWTFNATRWSEATPGGHPPALSGASLVYVASSDYAILFGGFTGSLYSNATWGFSNGAWTDLSLSVAPSPRSDSAATYSSALGGVVLFGGFAGGTKYLNDTWEFVHGAWSNVTGGPAPAPRSMAGFTFAATPLNESVLFGGKNATGTFSDTWEFNGTAWTRLALSTHPSGRYGMAFTYDGPDAAAILFGGLNGSVLLNDTWAFHSVTHQWTNLTPSMTGPSPPPRYGAEAAFQPYNGYVVLTGGYNFTHLFNDTWGFISGNWTDFKPATSPPGRVDAGLAYVRNAQYIAEFGGTGATSTLSDTWIWVAFTAEASASPNPTDVGVPVGFGVSAAAGVLPYSYAWTFGDGGTGSTASPSHTYAAPGTYLATVTVTDSKLPTHDVTSANVTVVVNPSMTVALTTVPAALNGVVAAVPAYSIAFNSTRTGGTGPYSYLWSFGDGSTAATENATHAYSVAGIYNVTIVVSDSVGASVTANVTVLIEPKVAASISVHPSTTDVGVPAQFNTTAIGGVAPISYAWQFGDGTGVGAQSNNSTSHVYTVAGVYTARVYVNDSVGDTYNATLTVTVHALPSAAILAAPTTVDAGVAVTFNGTASSGTAPFQYLWNFRDGSTSTTQNATHAYATPGSYPVVLVVTDALHQTANATQTITVVAAPVLTISATPAVGEAGAPIVLSASLTGGVVPISYSWLFGDGGTGSGTSVTHTYASAGSYIVSAYANDSVGVSAQATVTVHIAARLSATVTSSVTSADVGVPISFTGATTGGVTPISYAWEFGDGSTATTETPTHSFSSAGTYEVVFWANDSAGVSSVARTNITVAPAPTVSAFTVSPTSVSTGSTLTFTVTVSGGTGPFSYAYSGLPSGCNPADQSSFTCQPSSTGTFHVQVNVTDVFGRVATGSLSVTVTSPSVSTFLGLPTPYGYLVLALLALVVIGAVAWVVRGRRKRAKVPSDKGSSGGSEGKGPSEGGR